MDKSSQDDGIVEANCVIRVIFIDGQVNAKR